MRSALIPILLNSVPGWVRNAYPADVLPFLTLAAHYDQDLYWVRGRGQCSIDGIQTCTRAQTVPSYATTASGLLVPYAANTNRRTDLGVLPEQAAMNLALNSNDLTQATSWTLTNTTALSNQVTGPDGATSGGSLADNSTNGSHNAFASFTAVSGTTYTSSIYLKAGTATVAQLTFVSGQFSGVGYANFNLSNGTVSSTGGTLVASGIVAAANGFYRCWIAATATASAVANASVILTNNNASATRSPSYAGSGQALNTFGDQIEASAFPTSYIPTTTVPVTRATDFIIRPYNPLGAGNFTMFVSVGGVAVQTGKFPCLISVNDGSGLNQAQIYSNSGGPTASGKEATGGVTRFDTSILSSVSGGAGKIAMTLNGTAARGASNGGNLTALGTWTASSAFTQMEIGTSDGSGSNALNGYVKRIAIFQAGMTDAQMQALTT